MEFKYRLRNLRDELKISGEELGNILNVGKSTISMWENGKNMPTAAMIQKLADYFQVSTDYLLGKSDIRNINNENEDYRIAFDDIGKDYAELEDSEKDMIKTMIKAFKDKHQKK